MNSFDSRIIVVSKDYQFFAKIRQPLANEQLVSLVINVSTIGEAENKFITNKPNVMIVDTDTVSAGISMHIDSLTKKFSLLVILTGTSQSRAMLYTSGNVKDFLMKPTGPADSFINNVLIKLRPFIMRAPNVQPGAPAMGFKDMKDVAGPNSKVVLIASSTGGTDALEKVFKVMPADCPPILVVQHMPSGFTRLFAERLNNFYPMAIKEANTNDYVKAGQILIAPADQHMSIAKQGDRLIVRCFVGQKVHAVMPAADVLFESAVPILKQNAIGVVLTGMGSDGAKGLLQMHMQGAKTICQDEKTSVVYGMPKVAYELGAVDYKLPIDEIGQKILSLARG